MTDPIKPKRRPRYRGTHPRQFHEKYKELKPELYSQDIEKVKLRGMTPVGTHRPICVNEILEILKPRLGEVGLDATLGFGGHAQALLEKVIPKGKLVALDQDSIELPRAESRLRALNIPKDSLLVGNVNFRDAREFLKKNKIEKVNFILADLGVSSMQIDDPSRGFSFKVNAPLDLRMNPENPMTAALFVERVKEKDLERILSENSDEPFAEEIAKVICRKRPRTTTQMRDALQEVIIKFSGRTQKEEGDAPIRRTFQALRIAVNDEFSALDQFLEDIPKMLKPGGRVAILSFHSGEDRRVKKSFQSFERSGVYSQVCPELIRPSFEEQQSNPRSKSAKLRWAII